MRKEEKVTNSVRHVSKPWGSEMIWAETDDYVGKVIRIHAGHRLSLQLHEEKEESILVIGGKLRLHTGPDADNVTSRILEPGESAHIPPGMVHRFEAIEDTELVEVSTPQLMDVIRLQDDYGREGTNEP
ncbi:MAG TPA: cupin domain-containing protein [Acidimicrobiia bacterium]|nr:cupin domain-containing protein [Acidimicrobiia bacterium]